MSKLDSLHSLPFCPCPNLLLESPVDSHLLASALERCCVILRPLVDGNFHMWKACKSGTSPKLKVGTEIPCVTPHGRQKPMSTVCDGIWDSGRSCLCWEMSSKFQVIFVGSSMGVCLESIFFMGMWLIGWCNVTLQALSRGWWCCQLITNFIFHLVAKCFYSVVHGAFLYDQSHDGARWCLFWILSIPSKSMMIRCWWPNFSSWMSHSKY